MTSSNQIVLGLVGTLALLARLMLGVLEGVESFLRGLMATAGLSSSAQTLVLVTILSAFLFAGLRLPAGRLRSVLSSVLGLTLAHTLEHLARG